MAGRSVVGARHLAVNFVSFEFLCFLGAVYVFYWAFPQERARKWLLTAASYLFYAAWDWRFCLLMLFVTVNAFTAGRLLSSPLRDAPLTAHTLPVGQPAQPTLAGPQSQSHLSGKSLPPFACL